MSDGKSILVLKSNRPLSQSDIERCRAVLDPLAAKMDMASVVIDDGIDLQISTDLAPLLEQQIRTNELLQKLIDCQPKPALSTFSVQPAAGWNETAPAGSFSSFLARVESGEDKI